MSGLPSAHAIDAAEYAAIESTIGASERGRLFLAEHARRARAEEMTTVLAAIERLERTVTADRAVDAVGSLRGGLVEMAEAMADELQHRGQDPIDIGNRRLHSDRSE